MIFFLKKKMERIKTEDEFKWMWIKNGSEYRYRNHDLPSGIDPDDRDWSYGHINYRYLKSLPLMLDYDGKKWWYDYETKIWFGIRGDGRTFSHPIESGVSPITSHILRNKILEKYKIE